MNPLREVLVMLSTAPDERIAAARAALLGASPMPSPVADAIGIVELCEIYGVHRATVARKLFRAGLKPAKVIGGRNYYDRTAAVAAMEGQA